MDGKSSINAVNTPEEDSPLRETHSDPFKKPRWWREASSLSLIIGSMIAFCVAITVAMIIQIVVGAPQVVPHAGVLSDDLECSKMGLSLLQSSSESKYEDASSVDAAILTSLCLMVKNPHKGGLGGGGFMLIENQHEEKHHLTEINFREMSPSNVDTALNVSKNAVTRGQSIAVPGFLKGMKKAHDLFGKKPWKALFDAASQMAANGVLVNEELAKVIKDVSDSSIPEDLKALLTRDDNTTFLKENDTLTRKDLSETLKAIGEDPDSFYSGDIATSLLSVLENMGSNITLEDLKEYDAEVKTDVLSVSYKAMSVAASGIPSSGPVLLSTLNLLSESATDSTSEQPVPYHDLLEALKFSYGYQASWENCSQVNDSLRNSSGNGINETGVYSRNHYLNGLQPLDLNLGGEQHATVIGHDHLVVTVSVGIGSPFGSKVLSSGFLLNNAMLDFSWNGKNPQYSSDLKPSQANYIRPRQRPVSSMLAALISPNMTKCGLYMGFDAHTWTEAISSLTQLIVRKASGLTVESSIEGARLNQNMVPFQVQAEDGMEQSVLDNLKRLGHEVTKVNNTIGVCSAISYNEGKISFYGDKRDEEDSAQIF